MALVLALNAVAIVVPLKLGPRALRRREDPKYEVLAAPSHTHHI